MSYASCERVNLILYALDGADSLLFLKRNLICRYTAVTLLDGQGVYDYCSVYAEVFILEKHLHTLLDCVMEACQTRSHGLVVLTRHENLVYFRAVHAARIIVLGKPLCRRLVQSLRGRVNIDLRHLDIQKHESVTLGGIVVVVWEPQLDVAVVDAVQFKFIVAGLLFLASLNLELPSGQLAALEAEGGGLTRKIVINIEPKVFYPHLERILVVLGC